MKKMLLRDLIKNKAFNRCGSYSITSFRDAITYELNLMNSKQLKETVHL